MGWPSHIERWRDYVVWESKDIPTDLMLSIIAHESNGQSGIKSHAETRAAELPTDRGETITVNHAMGLTQVIPAHIQAWNQHKEPKITVEDMTGKDERSARLQIRLGSSIFASYVAKLNSYDPYTFPGTSPSTATPEQFRLALVAYAIGPGRTGGERGLIPKLEQLKAQGKPQTLAALAENFPKWGYSEEQNRWINKPLQAAQTVWSNYQQNTQGRPQSQAIEKHQPSKPSTTGWTLPALFLGAAVLLELTRNKELKKLIKRWLR